MVCLPESAPSRLIKHANFVEAARRADVEHLVYLSFLNPAPVAAFTQGRWHADTERVIDAAGLSRTFLRASLYQSPLLTSAGIHDGDRLLAPAGDGRIVPVAWQDIAAAAGPELLDRRGISSALSRATGRRTRYESITPQEFEQRLAGLGRPRALVDGLLGLFVSTLTGLSPCRSCSP